MTGSCSPIVLGLGQTGGGAGSPGPPGPPGAGYMATSTTSLTIAGSGSKSFTTQAGLAYTTGARIRATTLTNGSWMEGVATSYSGTTLIATMDLFGGSGTYTDWDINLAGERGATGPAAGTPTGTGFVHVTADVSDPVAQLVFNADVASTAALALTKLAAQADQTVVGNVSGGALAPVALTQAQLRTLLAYAAIALSGSASDLSTGTVPLARLSGITTTQLAAGAAVALTQLAAIADATFLGNNAGSTGIPVAMTVAQARTLLALAAIATSGSASDLTTGTVPLARLVGLTNAELSASAAIVLSKLATQADQTLVGNVSGGTAVPTALSQAQARTFLAYAAVALSGSASDLTTGTLPLARLVGITNTEISASAAIVLTKLATIAAHRYLGNNTGSAATPIELTATQLQAELADWNGNALSNFDASVVVDTSTARTLSATERGCILTLNNASAVTVTLPNSSEIGYSLTVYQKGAGQVSFTAASGATLRNRQTHTKLAGQYAAATLFVEANAGSAAIWVLAGDTTA